MAELRTEYVFNASTNETFQGIRQYDRYPEYLPGVTNIAVLPPKKPESTCQVRYDLKLIKSFYYTLNMYEEPAKRIWWDLFESNIMKLSNGSWDLKPLGKKTHATYTLDIVFRGFVPSRVVDQVTKATLPGMMEGFQKLIQDTTTLE